MKRFALCSLVAGLGLALMNGDAMGQGRRGGSGGSGRGASRPVSNSYRPPVGNNYRPPVSNSYRPPVGNHYRPPVSNSYRPPVATWPQRPIQRPISTGMPNGTRTLPNHFRPKKPLFVGKKLPLPGGKLHKPHSPKPDFVNKPGSTLPYYLNKNRKPGTTTLNLPGKFNPGKRKDRVLPPQTTSTLTALAAGNQVNGATKLALQKTLRGELLNRRERELLQSATTSVLLSNAQKSSLNTALQHDREERRKLQALTAIASGLSGLNSGGGQPGSSGGLSPGGGGQGLGLNPSPGVNSGPGGISGPVSLADGDYPPGPWAPEADNGDDPTPRQYGMQILELEDGPASGAGLSVGDIILGVNGLATPDLASLRAALEASGAEAEVVFISQETGEVHRLALQPEDSYIGATVQPVPVD